MTAYRARPLAIEFLTVPTVTFRVPYVFFVPSRERRRILHVNVTAHPYAAWAPHVAFYNRTWPCVELRRRFGPSKHPRSEDPAVT